MKAKQDPHPMQLHCDPCLVRVHGKTLNSGIAWKVDLTVVSDPSALKLHSFPPSAKVLRSAFSEKLFSRLPSIGPPAHSHIKNPPPDQQLLNGKPTLKVIRSQHQAIYPQELKPCAIFSVAIHRKKLLEHVQERNNIPGSGLMGDKVSNMKRGSNR